MRDLKDAFDFLTGSIGTFSDIEVLPVGHYLCFACALFGNVAAIPDFPLVRAIQACRKKANFAGNFDALIKNWIPTNAAKTPTSIAIAPHLEIHENAAAPPLNRIPLERREEFGSTAARTDNFWILKLNRGTVPMICLWQDMQPMGLTYSRPERQLSESMAIPNLLKSPDYLRTR
jgi:hypothetical protein